MKYPLDVKHRAWHRLFANKTPVEVVGCLEEWAREGRGLRTGELGPWNILFADASREQAIEITKKEWYGPLGEIPEHLKDFMAARASYLVRIDCLEVASRLVAGKMRWSDGWVKAFRKVADAVMRGIFSQTLAPLQKIAGNKSGGQSILDVQLRAIQDLFAGKCVDKFGIVVPVGIKYDGLYLFMLEQQTSSTDGVVRYLESSRIFDQIIHKLLAAIIFEDVIAGDKIIFAVDENDQAGIWRQKRPQE
ncbi:MAG: hypothetical protein AAB731_00615, partial [Patescibacteria group bacterium]